MSNNEPIEGEVLAPREKAAMAGEVLSLQGEIDPVELARIAEQRVEFFRKVSLLSLRRTSVHDWTDQGGKPYLQSTGAEKLMALWGIYTKDVEITVHMNLETGKPTYGVTGRVGSRVIGTEMDIVGGRSSEDAFFSNQPHLDLLDVRKAAYSNWLVNAVTRLIGMRGLTWEEIAEFTNGQITQAKATGKVSYNKPANQPSNQTASSAAPNLQAGTTYSGSVPAEILELQRLLVMIKAGDPSADPNALCLKYFTAKGGKQVGYDEVAKFRTPAQLGWVIGVCAKMKKDFSGILPPEQEEMPLEA